MWHTIQVQIILSNFKICNVPHHTGTAYMMWHTKVLKASIQLVVPVWCGTLQILKFDRIICTCMVCHITVYKVWYNNVFLYGVAHYIFLSFNTIICACMVWHITVLKVSIKLFVPIWCGTLQFLKFDTIICACMVRQINVQQLLIMCGTIVWHSPVLKVLIHLFELTSVLVQHSMVYKIINKNVRVLLKYSLVYDIHVQNVPLCAC
jgi:hypothetical protein